MEPDNMPTGNDIPLGQIDMTKGALWRDNGFGPLFARLRREAPIHYCPQSLFDSYWSVTRYHDIVHVESRPDIYSSSWKYGGITVAADRPVIDEAHKPLPMFIAMDPPEHTQQRRTVAPAFTPSEMDRMRAEVEARTESVLDSLKVGETFDWVDRVSIELSTGMLALLFDFPWEERRTLAYWSDWMGNIEALRDEKLRNERYGIIMQAGARFQQMRHERMAAGKGGHDLISMLAQGDATRDLTPEEFLGNIILLIVGGNDTSRNAMSALPQVVSNWPEEWAKIIDDPGLAINASQELIRWQTPLSHMRRTNHEEVELRGHVLPPRSKIVLWYMSGNRDEDIFPNADRFIADRENARQHLAFGHGIHRCVGARLATLHISTLIAALARRKWRPKVVGDIQRLPTCFAHGIKSTPVVLEAL